MHNISHRVARHINADPSIYVRHPLSRATPLAAPITLWAIREPLQAFGTDVLAYYSAPQGAAASRYVASGDRLIKSIDAATASFKGFDRPSGADTPSFSDQLQDIEAAMRLQPTKSALIARLAILDIPGPRLIMTAMLMGANKYSGKLIELLAFHELYTSFEHERRASNVFGWVLPALEKTGVDLDRFFDDMLELQYLDPVRARNVSPRQVPTYSTLPR